MKRNLILSIIFLLEEKKVVNLKVWIDDSVIYHSKIGQKTTLSSRNKLSAMACQTIVNINIDHRR
jgi:hypothetical protein